MQLLNFIVAAVAKAGAGDLAHQSELMAIGGNTRSKQSLERSKVIGADDGKSGRYTTWPHFLAQKSRAMAH